MSGCVAEASTGFRGVALALLCRHDRIAIMGCLHAEACAQAWNIPSPNARRKKPGLLAKAGLLKSKLLAGLDPSIEAPGSYLDAFS
ncbi:hypothetical protein [Bradyrhizobium acaciae]|uniref:hypothetical protein n=1 Tax=Bradyrhizobium acaciae TaxID=2683706 RepID=UPI001E3B47B2|nr:hypothetical protein [Bradyrhizobium acaciae]MCC8984337.1 hypothetical protein [Bradyrhizobium acaciae]